jgi:hypothetical protein
VHQNAGQIEIGPQLRQPIQAFGEGGVEAVNKDDRLVVVAGKRLAQVGAEITVIRVAFGSRDQKLRLRIDGPVGTGIDDVARLAIGRYGDVIARQTSGLAGSS